MKKCSTALGVAGIRISLISYGKEQRLHGELGKLLAKNESDDFTMTRN